MKDPGNAFVLALVLAGLVPSTATAAVRVCGDVITATGSASDELAAKKAALDLWKAEAEKLGTGFDGWRLAVNKVLTCKLDSGKAVCVASARPCTIEQAPNTRELRKKRLET